MEGGCVCGVYTTQCKLQELCSKKHVFESVRATTCTERTRIRRAPNKRFTSESWPRKASAPSRWLNCVRVFWKLFFSAHFFGALSAGRGDVGCATGARHVCAAQSLPRLSCIAEAKWQNTVSCLGEEGTVTVHDRLLAPAEFRSCREVKAAMSKLPICPIATSDTRLGVDDKCSVHQFNPGAAPELARGQHNRVRASVAAPPRFDAT